VRSSFPFPSSFRLHPLLPLIYQSIPPRSIHLISSFACPRVVNSQEAQLSTDPEKQKDLAQKFTSGKITIRDWRNQMQTVMGMGSISKLASMIPGLPAGMLDGEGADEAAAKLKKIVFITDAMTPKELESDGSCFVSTPLCSSLALLGRSLRFESVGA
jgi:hypothetical protein